jgi:hypothetical protein
MVALADIKKDLPDFPDEILEMWLLPLAEQQGMGWPPPNPFGNNDWQWVLGEKNLDWWKKVDWKLDQTDCSFGNLANGTRHIIRKMLAAHIDGEENAYSAAPDRFLGQLKHILTNGKFPKPVVIVPVKSGLSVVDGNNRIAAHACALSPDMPADLLAKFGGQLPSPMQQVWRGTHRDGEMIEE